MSLSTYRRQIPDSPRIAGDGGAVMIEFALIVPVLIMFLFGMLELVLLLKNQTMLINGLRVAARTDANSLSFAGNNRWADRDALDVFRSTTNAMNRSTLDRVVIYKPTNTSGGIPPACLSTATSNSGAGVTGNCNIFNANQLANNPAFTAGATSKFGAAASTTTCTTGAGGDWDQWWCPISRANDLTTGLDTVCIYSQWTYTYVTGVIPGNTQKITDKACVQAEPKV